MGLPHKHYFGTSSETSLSRRYQNLISVPSYPSYLTFYHVRDVKGRHDLITRGWTKLGAHARSNKLF